jgi:hypothetical protein
MVTDWKIAQSQARSYFVLQGLAAFDDTTSNNRGRISKALLTAISANHIFWPELFQSFPPFVPITTRTALMSTRRPEQLRSPEPVHPLIL